VGSGKLAMLRLEREKKLSGNLSKFIQNNSQKRRRK
jgi:hypothetical protein